MALGVSFGGDENILELDGGDVVQHYEYINATELCNLKCIILC